MPQLIKTLSADLPSINVGNITHLYLIPIYPELVVLDPVRYPGNNALQLAAGNVAFDQTRQVADVKLTPNAAKWSETMVGGQYNSTLVVGIHGNDTETRLWLDKNSTLNWLAAVRQTDGQCFLIGNPESGGLELTWGRTVEATQMQQLTLTGSTWHPAWSLPSLDATVLFASESDFDLAFDSSFKIS